MASSKSKRRHDSAEESSSSEEVRKSKKSSTKLSSKEKDTKKKKKRTKVFIEDFKGTLTFAIWEVDREGEKQGSFPIIAFGAGKAKALVKHYEELKDYVEENTEKD